MKFLCSSCNRLLEVERFRVEGAVLILSCSECGGESRAIGTSGNTRTATAPATVTPIRPALAPAEPITPAPIVSADKAFEVPDGHCPKCISRRTPDAPACPTCGLVFASSEPHTFAPSEWLKNEWLLLLQEWGNETRHEELRTAAMAKGELAETGRLYRLRLADQPQDPVAVRGRDEVLRLAVLPSLQLQQRAKGGETEVPRWKYIALSAVIVACLVAIYLLVGQMLQSS